MFPSSLEIRISITWKTTSMIGSSFSSSTGSPCSSTLGSKISLRYIVDDCSRLFSTQSWIFLSTLIVLRASLISDIDWLIVWIAYCIWPIDWEFCSIPCCSCCWIPSTCWVSRSNCWLKFWTAWSLASYVLT